MGAQPSSPKSGGARGGAGAIRSAPREPASPFAAAASDREARPPRRCLPLAWSGVQDLSDEEEDTHANSSPAKAPKQHCKEAWEPRPFSRDSTASTMSIGYQEDKLSFHLRPGSSSSRRSLPSTAASTASLGRRTSLSSCASSSMPSPAAISSSSASPFGGSAAFERPDEVQVSLTDVKLEDARQRAAKSMETLNQLMASRRQGASPSSGSQIKRQMQGSQSTHRGQASSSTDTPSKVSFKGSRDKKGEGGTFASPATKSRQAWMAREEECADHVNIPIDSEEISVARVAYGGKAGKAGPGAELPKAAAAPFHARSQARGPLPTRLKAQSFAPRPDMLGHTYLDPSDGV